MRRLAACTVLLTLVAAGPADARKRPKHRFHAPPTPKIRPGKAAPLAAPTSAPVAVTPLQSPTVAPEAPVAPGEAPAPLPRTVGVAASEFKLTLTRTAVGAGAVTIQLRNAGEDGHDLRVDALDGTPLAAWDELPAEAPAVTKVVTLTAGTYRLYCSLPGHAAQGMDTRLTVS